MGYAGPMFCERKRPAAQTRVAGLSWVCTVWYGVRVVVYCSSLCQPKIQPSNGVHSVDGLVLYGNTDIFFLRYTFLMASNPDRITPGRRFSQLFEIFHYDRINGGFPSSPTPSSSFLFFVNTLISRTLDARE